MNNNDVQLWFANDKDKKIVTINEVEKELHEEYTCPICGSKVIPRQGKEKAWHFAHEDASKCDGETRIHWWVKNKLIEKGSKFIVKTDKEKEYVCKELLIEQSYKINNNTYKPDLTVITETGEIIYFEVDHTNKKNPDDYMSIWIDLNNIVVEVNTQELINTNSKEIPAFKALFYDGKCREVKKNNTYYNTIGKYKEDLIKNGGYNEKKDEIKKLDWFWKDIMKYKIGEVDIEYLSKLIQSIEEETLKDIVVNILKKASCNLILQDYIQYNKNILKKIINPIKEKLDNIFIYKIGVPRLLKERIYEGAYLDIIYKNKHIYTNITYKDINKITEDNIINAINNRDLEIKEYKTKKEIFDIIRNFKIDTDYSYLCTNMKCSGFPKINYYYSNYKYEDRLYLNYFKNAEYGEYITVNECNTEKEMIKYIHDKLGTFDDKTMFTKDEIIKINNISGDLKNKFKDKIEMYLYDGNKVEVQYKYVGCLSKSYTLYRFIKEEFNIGKMYEISEKKIYDLIDKIEKNINKEKSIKILIKELNKKYKLINGNWSFKKRTNDDILNPSVEIVMLKNNKIFDPLGETTIYDFYNDNINYDKLKEQLANEISNYIRDYVYQGGNK